VTDLPEFIYLDSTEPGMRWGREFWTLRADRASYTRIGYCEIDYALLMSVPKQAMEEHKGELLGRLVEDVLRACPRRLEPDLMRAYVLGAKPKGVFLALCAEI